MDELRDAVAGITQCHAQPHGAGRELHGERACDRLVSSASVAPSPQVEEVPGSIPCGDEFRWIFQDFLVAFNTCWKLVSESISSRQACECEYRVQVLACAYVVCVECVSVVCAGFNLPTGSVKPAGSGTAIPDRFGRKSVETGQIQIQIQNRMFNRFRSAYQSV